MAAELFRERLPALQHSATAPELVLLHGWAGSSAVWRPLLSRLRQWANVQLVDLPGHGASPARPELDANRLLQELLRVLPGRAIYLGWSLGGMLATRLAAQAPERVQALITVAANAVFVQQPDWPEAMPREQWHRFREGFSRQPQKSLSRFQALQCHGDAREKELLRELRRLPGAEAEGLLEPLDWLQTLDNRDSLSRLRCPALHIFGEDDALVPVAVQRDFEKCWPGQHTRQLEDCAHLPFLSQPDRFLEQLESFLQDVALRGEPAALHIDKRAVARSFSRAASSYDRVAHLQRRVADRLLAELPEAPGETVVDIGCGTGYSLPGLRQRFPAAPLWGLDLAEGMLRYAADHRQADGWICGDAEDLPLADSSAALLFSSLSLQWCENLPAAFAEAYRVLRPGGWFAVSTLGPSTLEELRGAWQAVDSYTHVNRFADREELNRAIASSGLLAQHWLEEWPCLYYGQLGELMSELKQLGAHNINNGRPGGLTTRARLRRLIEAYERHRCRDGLPATYQVWYLLLRKVDA